MGRLPTLATLRLLLFVAPLAVSGCSSEPKVVPPPAECSIPAPTACADDIGATLPFIIDGTTVGREDMFGGASCGLGGDTIEDMAFRWTAPSADTYLFSTEGSTIDTFLSLRQSGCLGREFACNDDADAGMTHSEIEIELSACETITIVVDGPSIDAVGDFRLSIRGTEKICDDGVDEDGDGLLDCADPDCFGSVCRGPDLWPESWSEIEWEILALVNMHRENGATCISGEQSPAPLLEMDEDMRFAARLHSEDMLENGYFEHDSLDGRTFVDRLREAGFMGAAPLGENIVRDTPTAAGAVAAWMGSDDGHCENIMNPAFRVIGVGWAAGPAGSRGTQDFAASH